MTFSISNNCSDGCGKPPLKNKTHKFLKIGVPIIAVGLIATIVVVLIFTRTNPLLVTGRALSNFSDELSERIDTTPLKALGMLIDTLEDGVVTVSVDYVLRWLGSNRGDFTLSSNRAQRDFALKAEVTFFNRLDFEAEMFLNKERLAMTSSIMDEAYYGITLSTFRADIQDFGSMIGLDAQTMGALADAVEMLEWVMNMPGAEDAALKPYVALLEDFVRGLRPSAERIRVESESESVSVTRIEYIVTEDKIAALLYDIADLISEDENMSGQLESLAKNPVLFDALEYMFAFDYSEIVQKLGDLAHVFENGLSGEIAVVFYIGAGDRLLSMEISIDANVDGKSVLISGAYDFGKSAQDRWQFTGTKIIGDAAEHITILWTLEEYSDEMTNIFTIYDAHKHTLSLLSRWNPESGALILEFPEEWDFAKINGTFLVDEDTFTLTIDRPSQRRLIRSVEVTIATEAEAQIRNIEFINIDQWRREVLYSLERVLLGLIGF
ncbi:MAG: hypothetical protein FWC75_01040 [Oscillospiraceae bacterium]|nr:hypothetical protein [Oscillospiraceae bacterium]